MIVVDTNLIAYLIVTGEQTASAEAVLRKDSEWVAPKLWRSELRNVLATYIRAGHFGLAEAVRLMAEAESVLVGVEYDISSRPILELAERSGCSAYDCEFVHLAQELDVPLITSDRQLIRAFPDIAIHTVSFATV